MKKEIAGARKGPKQRAFMRPESSIAKRNQPSNLADKHLSRAYSPLLFKSRIQCVAHRRSRCLSARWSGWKSLRTVADTRADEKQSLLSFSKTSMDVHRCDAESDHLAQLIWQTNRWKNRV